MATKAKTNAVKEPTKRASAAKADSENASSKRAPAKKAPLKTASAKKAPLKTASAKTASANSKSAREAGAKKIPSSKATPKHAVRTQVSREEGTAHGAERPKTRSELVAAELERQWHPERVTPPDDDGAVVITGICGNFGRLLASHLHKTERLIGIDERDFPGIPKDIIHYRIDLRRKKAESVFRHHKIKAVIHLGIMHNPRVKTREHHHYNIIGTTRVLECARRHEIPRVIVLSSANIYGARPDNDTFLTEEAPLLGSQTYTEMTDIVEVDMLAQSYFWKAPAMRLFILRPTHVVGPRLRSPASRYLQLDAPPTLLGYDPMVQLLHERDLIGAFEACLTSDARGVFNLAGPDEAPLSKILAYLRRRPYPVPGPLLRAALENMWQLRMTTFPAAELQYINYACMVDSSLAQRELGFHPRYSLEDTLRSVM